MSVSSEPSFARSPLPNKIAVLGAGAWGSALAIHLAKAGHQVTLWSHGVEQAEKLEQARENSRYLPNIAFPDNLSVTASLTAALGSVESVLVVVPSGAFRSVLGQLSELVDTQKVHIAWATKGFEPETQSLLHQVAQQVLGKEAGLTVLSGPTFADEVAKGSPTAMVSASPNLAEAQYWADVFHFGAFRIYTQADMVGVEVGGAYKNIMAIATGLSDGLGLGANARAALVSRGMVEMMRLGQALGGQPETLMGLAGLGDLVLTCTDDLSRNRRFGKRLAQSNQTAEAVMDEIGQVVEGVKAVIAVKQIAQRLALDLPIMEQVYLIVSEKTTPKEAVMALLARSGKSEG
ncbi:MAG: NAD(P)-dependent glycerol-3-phosphate dehydrogenase [Gammaproteobacteria bacterium]|nr:NAD(P)-dependent glycerol-3-phosphate dehydrogenase [Gammaproteobacteria bacterium]